MLLTVSMTPVEIRFHGNSSSNHQNQGLVDLKLYNKWGRICADNFGGEEADVVCRMLGYSGYVYRGSNMSAHVLLNLLNELGKRDKMRGMPSILSFFRNEFNKFNNSRS